MKTLIVENFGIWVKISGIIIGIAFALWSIIRKYFKEIDYRFELLSEDNDE